MKKMFRFDENVENSKRRQALPPFGGQFGDWKFFERLLDVKKSKDPVFIPKSAKGR